MGRAVLGPGKVLCLLSLALLCVQSIHWDVHPPSCRLLLQLSLSQCTDLSRSRTKVLLMGIFLFLKQVSVGNLCGPRGLCQGRLFFKHWSCRNSFSLDSGAEEVQNRLLSLSSSQQGPRLQLLILLGFFGLVWFWFFLPNFWSDYISGRRPYFPFNRGKIV